MPTEKSPAVTEETATDPNGSEDRDLVQSTETDESGSSSPEATPDENAAEDLFSAISKALPEEEEGAEAPETEDTSTPEEQAQAEEEGGEDASEEAGAEQDDVPLEGDPDEKELSSYRPRTRKRIEQLLSERNEAREVAQQAAPIVDYMRDNDIPQEDVDVILGLAARLRQGDFAGFIKGVEPYLDLAKRFTGDVLPDDLRQQVQQGFISTQAARELASHRAMGIWQQQESARQQQAMQAQMVQQTATSIRSAVADWETRTRQSDPDYAMKADIVRRVGQALVQQFGPPRSPQEAVQYAQKAYDEANQQVQRFRPQPKATQKTPSGVHQASTTPKQEPGNFFDVVKQGLADAQG